MLTLGITLPDDGLEDGPADELEEGMLTLGITWPPVDGLEDELDEGKLTLGITWPPEGEPEDEPEEAVGELPIGIG